MRLSRRPPGDSHQSHVRLLTRHCTPSHVFRAFRAGCRPSPSIHKIPIDCRYFGRVSCYLDFYHHAPRNIVNARPSNLSRIIKLWFNTFRCGVLLVKWETLRYFSIALLLFATAFHKTLSLEIGAFKLFTIHAFLILIVAFRVLHLILPFFLFDPW